MTNVKSYKQLEQELNEVLSRVESGSYDEIDELLKDYEKGMAIASLLEEKLKTAKNTIIKVKKAE